MDRNRMSGAAGFFKPHTPFEAPESMYAHYPLDAIKARDPLVEALDVENLTLSGCTSLRHLAASPEDAVWEERTQAVIAAYLACVTHVDSLLAPILAALAGRRRTIVVLWSDHGSTPSSTRS